MYKSHTCGELRISDVSKTVTLAGWVNRRRDHGGVTFIDMRDRFGITQVVSDPVRSPEAHQQLSDVRNEWVIQISGTVHSRPAGAENPNLPTGEIEIEIQSVKVLNSAKTPPFSINKEEEVDELVRLHYRYLDLRRERMRRNLELRHNVVRYIRDYLIKRDFWEIETPILFKTTPEGARDYLVPSRVHPGEFYALPQSPQQLKQMLMVAGIERYFQIARCFRDEDQRGDRQPEFTQLDLEMSFIEREDIMQLIETMFTQMVRDLLPHKRLYQTPWPRLTYQEAMERYGKDNPDIRFELPLVNITDIANGSGFKVFEATAESGGHIRGINAKGLGEYSRKEIDELTEFARSYGAKGLAYLAVSADGNHRSTFSKFLSEEFLHVLFERMEALPGDLLLFVADKPAVVFEVLGRLRVLLGERLGLIERNVLGFCWVIDFPFVNWNEEENRWDPSHHLFTSPMLEDLPLLDVDPGKSAGTAI